MLKANLIVTCTNKKRVSVPDDLMLRNISGVGRIEERLDNWINSLEKIEVDTLPAQQLYSGDHWNVIIKDIVTFPHSFPIQVWVASAGYGLVRLTAPLKPYAVTFTQGSSDSIYISGATVSISKQQANQQWWKLLSKWKGPEPGQPRSIMEIAQREPDQPLLVAASEDYLQAIAHDLQGALLYLNDSEDLSIVSFGTKKLASLNKNLIPCDARLQPILGGVRGSLNVRLLSKIIAESEKVPLKANALRQHYHQLTEQQAPIIVYDRAPISDEEIKTFIRTQLKINRSQKHTPLLRILRRELNQACEQSRFKQLYQNVIKEYYAPELF
ncbi:MAG: hypothetical protein HQM12_20655 [SAR324 cluster bacterium]|nr:hypothetical protein [SAR324 cluster bacterium]